MRAEAHEEAERQVGEYAVRANGIAGIAPERIVREGEQPDEVLNLIEEDEDISVLVLAAGIGYRGAGPAGRRPRPQAPGPFRFRSRSYRAHLTDAEPRSAWAVDPEAAS